MSREVFEEDGLFVTRYAGPASEGEDRRRWQLTIPRDIEYVQFTAEQLQRLVTALQDDLR